MPASPASIDQHRHSGRRRLVLAGVGGAVTALVVSWVAPWELTILLAFDVAAIAVVVRSWAHAFNMTPADTRSYSTVEDNSRTLADIVLLAACVVSLVGVALAFVKANEGSSSEEIVLKVAGITSILLAWLLVHTIYAFKYAHAYYLDPIGGIDFKSKGDDEAPDYRDFAYVAFTVGMTYQVADTDVTHRTVRHLVLGHALLSFVFGAVILATVVNLIAGLLNS
ncbi:MAG: DUF1345 domain-containing protein [Acidimicrobiia bacterium]